MAGASDQRNLHAFEASPEFPNNAGEKCARSADEEADHEGADLSAERLLHICHRLVGCDAKLKGDWWTMFRRPAIECVGSTGRYRGPNAEGGRGEATASAEQSLSLFQARYEGGVDTYLQVVTWQTAALYNERNDLDIMQRRLDASVLLIKALGGGWDTSKLPQL
jgi:hypothetical protein